MCPHCQNPNSEDGSDCMSPACIQRRRAERPQAEVKPVNKVAVVRGYGYQVETEAEALALAEQIMICDNCYYEGTGPCCGVPGAGVVSLAAWWRRAGDL